MAAAGGVRGSEPGMASASGSASDTSLLGSATVWHLKRYGRFLPPKDGDEEERNTSWKVFESNEESGPLVLTIVESGHFFISQERTVLNECRMFRVQFSGSCREEMQQHCCSCVQKLSQYVPVQGPEEQLGHGLTHSKGSPYSMESFTEQFCVNPWKSTVAHLLGIQASAELELPPVLRHPAWSARELGPFIRLCLLDQHFPAFVQDVERELHRLAEE
uniref:REC114 meiotic recombination protein n=1 Tax=Zosterops lateralis melanops TaxID=1220523 RepID=A0A8D2P2T0_ZOSLA